jgi:alpha-tubulin suppressor-like RCC1 family protein
MQSISDRGFSDGLSLSSDSLCFSEASLPLLQTVEDFLIPHTPNAEPQNIKKNGSDNGFAEFQKNMCHRIIGSNHRSQRTEKNDVLKDVLIWGEGAGGGNIGCVSNHFGYHSTLQVDSLLPKLLEPTVMLDVRNISLGRNHAALITKRGEVFCWGEGSRGKLGHKVDMDVSSPTIVESLDGFLVKFVACGEYQTCALTDSGELFVWGENKYGGNLVCEERTGSQWLPRQISGPLAGVSISNVACGDWHTAAVSSSGQLFTYGDGTFGVLGHGNLQSVSHPKEVESLKGLWVKSVACGSWHTAAIVDVIFDRFKFNGVRGKLFTWGDGDKGRLGHADLEKKLQPTCVAQLVEHDFVQVSCGRMLTVALTRTGKIYTMGSSVHGQLGNPQAKNKSIAIVEGKLKEEFVKEISSGSYHVAALTSGGSVYTWGKGTNGQLGLGNVEDRNVPTLVEALRDRQVQSIACGSNLTAAICLHKSISVSDQSACKGCRMPFGFTRKKHNCYNCGLLFCRACSSKKLINASLAPNKSKLCRVCDSCFNSLQNITHPGGGSRKLLSQQKALSDEKEERGGATPPGHRLQLMCRPSLESQPGERKTSRNQGEKQQHLETVPSISAGLPRWGQVSCPAIFESCYRKDSVHPLEPISSSCSSLNLEEDKHESNNILVEEVERLRAQVMPLYVVLASKSNCLS